jgi:hypothetical protein
MAEATAADLYRETGDRIHPNPDSQLFGAGLYSRIINLKPKNRNAESKK